MSSSPISTAPANEKETDAHTFRLRLAGAAQPRPVGGLVLSNDQWPRATDLKQWTAEVMRISGARKQNGTAQGKAFFERLRLFSRMAAGGTSIAC